MIRKIIYSLGFGFIAFLLFATIFPDSILVGHYGTLIGITLIVMFIIN